VAKEQRTAKYFNSLSPTGVRTVKSFASRWGEMQAAYKYLLDIQIFNLIYIITSTLFQFRRKLTILIG